MTDKPQAKVDWAEPDQVERLEARIEELEKENAELSAVKPFADSVAMKTAFALGEDNVKLRSSLEAANARIAHLERLCSIAWGGNKPPQEYVDELNAIRENFAPNKAFQVTR